MILHLPQPGNDFAPVWTASALAPKNFTGRFSEPAIERQVTLKLH